MNEYPPCKGCTDRHPACHGSCEAYKEWRERYQAQQKHLADNKSRWDRPWSTAREKSMRTTLKYGPVIHKNGGSQ